MLYQLSTGIDRILGGKLGSPGGTPDAGRVAKVKVVDSGVMDIPEGE